MQTRPLTRETKVVDTSRRFPCPIWRERLGSWCQVKRPGDISVPRGLPVGRQVLGARPVLRALRRTAPD